MSFLGRRFTRVPPHLRSAQHFTRLIRTQAQQQGGPDGYSSSGPERFNRPPPSFNTPPFAMATPRQLTDYLNQYVVGQESAKKTLSVAVYNHHQRLQIHTAFRDAQRDAFMHGPEEDFHSGVSTAQIRPTRKPLLARPHPPPPPAQLFDKSNVLIIGPTGTGKTLLLRSLARAIDVPFSVSDATTFTQAGYVGDDVDACISRLLAAANGDPVRAGWGIVYLDEIDKLAKKTGTDGSRDVGGEGVQQSLLRMMEGTTVTVQVKGDGGGKSDAVVHIDTTNILFVMSGAFVGLENVVRARQEASRGSIGFSSKTYFTPAKALDRAVEPADLVKYGFIPEFISRLPSIATLSALTASDLRRILTEVKYSLVSQYNAQFANTGIELKFTSAAVDEICSQAIARGTGARGLRAIMENVLLDAMHDLPGSDVRHALVTDATIRGESPVQCWTKSDNSIVAFWETWAAEERKYRENKEEREKKERQEKK
ncbi:P-loop containing nucleoside triphosphate hydrolase protein [Mycena alexandri]|uniref:P-loop containing nucleoside triphosphate hydrolase protein n=1 Tax=Mycena alexandri TaxID=1745969 RepID=A0AAD6TPJ7_9AGAR|nr:P-loop containing nucleoside triphosphate hydrolase protein [Mycena alexandri]